MSKGGVRPNAGRKPIEERITLNLSRGDKALLDQRRGKVSRSAYIRQLVREKLSQKGPKMKHSISLVPGDTSFKRVMDAIQKDDRFKDLGLADYQPGQIDGNGESYDLLQFASDVEIPEELENKILMMNEVIVTTFNIEEKMDAIRSTLDEFLSSPDFGEGCKSATKASWGGSGYSVELFSDGTWHVLWDDEIGNRYESKGEIISLPTLDDDDYQQCVAADDAPMTEDEYFLSVFQNDEEKLKQYMRDKLAGVA